MKFDFQWLAASSFLAIILIALFGLGLDVFRLLGIPLLWSAGLSAAAVVAMFAGVLLPMRRWGG